MKIKQDILWRFGLTYIIFLIIGILILIKILYIQFVEGKKYKEISKNNFLKYFIINPVRGSIYSSDGKLLSTSIPYYDIYFDLNADGITDNIFYSKIDSLSICLFELFKNSSAKSVSDYKRELINARKRGERYYLIKRKVDYHQLMKLKKFPIFREGRYKGGLIYEQKYYRLKPHNDLAARIIGYITTDKSTGVGIEQGFDKYLSGKPGIILKQKILGNTWIPLSNINTVDPQDGYDVISTINVEFQDIAHKALLKQLTNFNAHHGTVIIMEVQTGKILAMVNLGKDKNNNYSEIQNYAVSESYEPGSVFKLPVIIAALEEGKVDLNDTIDTGNGIFKYYDKIIKDDNYDKGGNGKITLKRVFEVSSNIGMVKCITSSFKNEEKQFINRLYMMKLNKKLDIPIPGEPAPYIKYPDDPYWSGISLGMIAHGYEIKLTPLQILTFYNSIANNGKMVKPLFVTEIKYCGKTIEEFQTEIIDHSICSKSTLKKAQELLRSVVENGTAKNINIPLFKIAGKTGTSQIFNPETKSYKTDNRSKYVASFVGYFPADRPKYSCIVVINSPSGDIYHGSEVAAPVFLEIAKKIYTLDIDFQIPLNNIEVTNIQIPYSKNGSIEDVLIFSRELKIPIIKYQNTSEYVRTIKVETGIECKNLPIVKGIMPDVISMGAKDAIYLLEKMGLKVIVIGRGSVKSQSIPAGTKINKGDIVKLEMSNI